MIIVIYSRFSTIQNENYDWDWILEFKIRNVRPALSTYGCRKMVFKKKHEWKWQQSARACRKAFQQMHKMLTDARQHIFIFLFLATQQSSTQIWILWLPQKYKDNHKGAPQAKKIWVFGNRGGGVLINFRGGVNLGNPPPQRAKSGQNRVLRGGGFNYASPLYIPSSLFRSHSQNLDNF